MAKPTSSSPTLTSGQAHYVLTRLVKERRVNAAEIRQYLGMMQQEIKDLEAQLQALREASSGGLAPGARLSPGRSVQSAAQRPAARPGAAASAPGANGAVQKRRKPHLSPERREQLRLQGHFLSLLHQTPASRRSKFKVIRKQKGLKAAVDALRSSVK
jgi:hypothetical protein